MTKLAIFIALVAMSLVSIPARAEDPKPQMRMAEYTLGILSRGPNAATTSTPEGKKILGEHLAHIRAMAKSGKLVVAGPITDDSGRAGVFVWKVKQDEARALGEADPAVKAGIFTLETHPWWAVEGVGTAFADLMEKTAPEAIKLADYQIVFLTRGSAWTPEKTPETAKIQEGHMANITRLAREGSMWLAGPMGDNGDLRGIFIFRVADVATAKALSETDPAVKAGRLAISVHPWRVPEGLITKPVIE